MAGNTVKAAAGFGIAFLIIGAFTWAVGWGEIVAAVAGADNGLLLAGGLTSFAGIIGLGAAWLIVVRDVAPYGPLDGLRVYFATMFANSVTPLGQFGGEPFIAYILSRDAGIPYEESLGAVMAADLLNAVQFFSLSFLGIIVFLLYFPLGPLVATILQIAIGLVILLALATTLLWTKQQTAIRLMGRLGAWLDRLFDRMHLERGAFGRISRDYMQEKTRNLYGIVGRLLQERRMVVEALTVSHLAGLLSVAGLYLIVLSLGIDAPKSALLFLLPASMLAGYLPLPGGLGGIEVALTSLLTGIAGVPLPVAGAAALLFRVATYWSSLLIGGVFVSRFSVDLFGR